jgi:hypothetical protein
MKEKTRQYVIFDILFALAMKFAMFKPATVASESNIEFLR